MLASSRLLLWAVLVSPALAGAAGPGAARLSITATPDALRLAEGSRATLRIVGASESPVLSASVGRIDVLREVSSGVYEAEYLPPDSLDPQIAFVAVVSADGFGWVPIALAGVRDVVVSARHGTPVSVSVEDEDYGPVPADGMGRAVVRVVVPPGVRTARYGKQRMDLAVPEKSLVHVLLSSAEVDANAGASLTVRALAVTERGKPRAKAPVTLVASEGMLSPAVEIAPGVFEAQWKVERGKVGQAQVTARLRDRAASVATATLARVPGPPHSIAVELDRDRLVAGEGDELAVTARVLDVAGNTTECATSILVDSGVVLEWERTGRGHYDGRVQVPRQRAGRQQLEIRVVASQTLSATRVVPLLPGTARQVRIEAEGGLQADGRRHRIRISVLDRDGNRVDVADVPSVTATRGAIGAPARYAPGAYRLDYRTPLAAEDFDDLVRARVGTLEGEARFRVRALGGGVVLAPKVGVAVGSGGLRSPSGGVEVAFWTRSFDQGLGLVLEGQVYGLTRRDTLQGLSLKSEVTFLSLSASLAWRRPVGGWLLWLGAGGGAVNTSSRVAGITGQGTVSGQAWGAAAQASVGLGRPLGPGVPFGELRFAWQADAGGGPVRGSLQSVALQVGYRFDVL
jgi:hypothetical protein